MKKYLFGLGAMLVGAGLMFVFTHTEVSADSTQSSKGLFSSIEDWEGWVCDRENTMVTNNAGNGYTPSFLAIYECKKGNVICYRTIYSANGVGLSCLNTGIFQ